MASGGDQSSDERVLSPEELDIEDEEDVAPLGDGRYVIGADGPPSTSGRDAGSDAGRDARTNSPEPEPKPEPDPVEDAPEAAAADGESGDAESGDADDAGEPKLTGRDVKRWLGDELADHDSSYAYHIAAKSGGTVTHQQLATDDIGAAFDGLLVWYARQVAEGTPVDEALGILLAESSVQIRYPTARLVAYLEQHDLGPDDTIADLVSAVSEEDGLVFPHR